MNTTIGGLKRLSLYMAGQLKSAVAITGGTISGVNISATGTGSATLADGATQPALFGGGATPTAGNMYGIAIQKTGVEEAMIGINKSTTTGSVPASAVYISTYNATGSIAIGRGNTAGAPNTADLLVNSSGVTFGTYALRSVGNALTAAGTTRADALQLAKEVNNITTAAASTGVILPVGVIGMRITVFNGGENAIKVYASGSETIDGTAGATGVALTNAKRCDYFFTAANTWISAQLGVVSA